MRFISISVFTLLLTSACSTNNLVTPGPNKLASIAQMIGFTRGLDSLHKAIQLVGDSSLYSSTGPYTLFAPNDSAFVAYLSTHSKTSLAQLYRADTGKTLRRILAIHTLPGTFNFIDGRKYFTLQPADSIRISLPTTGGDSLFSNSDTLRGVAFVPTSAQQLTNGVVYVVAGILP